MQESSALNTPAVDFKIKLFKQSTFKEPSVVNTAVLACVGFEATLSSCGDVLGRASLHTGGKHLGTVVDVMYSCHF